MISKADFLKTVALKRKTVTIDAISADVEVVEMDLSTRGEMMTYIKQGVSNEKVAELILSRCVPMLESPTPDEINAISPPVAAEIVEAVLDLSGMASNAVDDAIKN